MRFENFLEESTTGITAFNKYFKDRDVETFLKKDTPVYDKQGKNTDEIIPQGSKVVVPKSSKYDNGKVIVVYKNIPYNISFNLLDKGAKTGGEKLRITTNKLTQTAKSEMMSVDGKEFDAKVFYSAKDIANSVINGIYNISTIPENLKTIIIKNLNSNKYSKFDWGTFDDRKLKQEISKYYGEILIGLCVLNGELKVFNKSPIKSPNDVLMFIVPTSSSFAGIDSIFEMKDGTFIPISSKSGVGASASFHANLIPKLISYVDNGGRINNPLLKYMTKINMKRDIKNMEFIYDVGMDVLMSRYLKGSKGKYIKNNSYKIYQNLAKGILTPIEEYLMDVVRNNSWPVTKNQKTINDKLPDSFTYFICQNIAFLLNSDPKAIQLLTKLLTYWQANLDLKKFVSTGDVKFNMTKTNKGNLKMVSGKGSMSSVKTQQGRLTYIIK